MISKDVLKFFSALFQMKEAKRLKEFLEDYDDERDDPKFYRFFFFFFTRSKEGYTFSFCTSGDWILILLTQGECFAEANP